MARSTRVSVLAIWMVIGLLANSTVALAADGDFDPGFADGGMVQLEGDGFVSEIVTDSLGGIYAVGAIEGVVFVYSLLANGTPNTEFGIGGRLYIGPEDASPDGLLIGFPSASIDSQGRLVVAAHISTTQLDRLASQFWTTRLLPTGEVDPGFTAGAVAGHPLLDVGYNQEVEDVLIDSVDRILIVGSASETSTSAARPVVVRVAEAGSLDASFGTTGVAFSEASFVGPVSGALDRYGRLLVAAPSALTPTEVGVFRMLDDGSVDPSFKTTLVDLGARVTPSSMSIGPDDRIVVGGYTETNALPSEYAPFLMRVHSDGALDRGLQGRGWLRPDLPTAPFISGVDVDSDNRIVIASDYLGERGSSVVLRLMRSGLPDTSFGVNGVAAPLELVSLGAATLSPDGLLVGGFILDPDLFRPFVARLEVSPVADVDFTDDDGSVFAADIEALARAGITRGCNPPTNDRFCPGDLVTRGEMAALLVRGLGYSDAGGGDLFVDDDDSLFADDIDKLGTAAVTLGCNPPANDRFCPNRSVTRGEMAAFLVRALGYSDVGGGDLFVDDDDSLFESDIDKLGTAGVTLGCNPPTNDMFCPDTPVTRGQMAAFLARALDL